MNNTIGIVIVNYFSYKDTIRLVSDLQKQKGNLSLTIVVVDNYSPNNSYRILQNELSRYPNTIIVQSGANIGYARGNNIGLKLLEKKPPKYVAIMNNDIYFEDDLLISLINRYKVLENVAFIAPVQYEAINQLASIPSLTMPSFKNDLLSYLLLYRLIKKNNQYSIKSTCNTQKVDIILGSLMFTDFVYFRGIGYFYPNTFLFCEERFLAMKVKKSGKYNYIVSDLKYLHKHSSTIQNHVNAYHQNRYLHEGKIKYTSVYRRSAKLKCFLLNIAYLWGNIETVVFNSFSMVYHQWFKTHTSK